MASGSLKTIVWMKIVPCLINWKGGRIKWFSIFMSYFSSWVEQKVQRSFMQTYQKWEKTINLIWISMVWRASRILIVHCLGNVLWMKFASLWDFKENLNFQRSSSCRLCCLSKSLCKLYVILCSISNENNHKQINVATRHACAS